MKKFKLAILPGDGIGKDVMSATLPVFAALNIPVEFVFGDIGWECWKQTGNPIPEKTWEIIQSCDAVLLGATTSMPEKEALNALLKEMQVTPSTYVSPIVQLRQKLDLYANVRPCFNIKGHGDYFNFSIIRENTEGLYAGLDFYPLPDKLQSLISEHPRWCDLASTDASCSLRLQSRKGLMRLFEFAFNYADREKFTRVTFADKPNVLRKSSVFSRELFEVVAKKYPHIQSDIHNVDAVALWMIRRPQEFGVIVAENMFGDILSDLGAGIMGGLGFAPSANIGEHGCYFEPVHGSAPRIQTNCANPSAMFLTIGLLLKHFGYHDEAHRIQETLQSVLKENEFVTYDLAGSASTKIMSAAIIQRCIQPKIKKTISLLATGSEIIQGDIQDTNGHFFAKKISECGGNIYQHIQVSDKKNEISAALKYLLSYSDAVIICGGLGPTSDDVTRFAVADIVKRELIFNNNAWSHIVKRLESFGLTVNDSNKQQALFPAQAEIYPNNLGTAFGCQLELNGKFIFMLPGPPNECRSLFYKFVIPVLKKNNYFAKKKLYRWLTLGLIESEIAPKIDALLKTRPAETAYRWNYPYLEIKLISNDNENVETLFSEIETLISDAIVSKNGENAFDILEHTLQSLNKTIGFVDEATNGEFLASVNHRNLKPIETEKALNSVEFLFRAKSSKPLKNQTDFSGRITLECEAFTKNQKRYTHVLSIPNRGTEVMDYAKNYIAWQLQKSIIICGV